MVPPSTLDPRLPKELDEIVARALAYDPERRYGEARHFAEALVDILFPTPHSAVQDLLNQQMHQVFGDKIARLRQARAHDALIMKVLTNLADRSAEGSGTTPAGLPPLRHAEPPELEPLAELATPTQETRATPSPRPAQRPVVVQRRASAGALALATLLGAGAGAGAAWFGSPWLRPGALVVTSEPSGVAVALDGQPTGLQTPAVLEGVALARPHEVTLSGPSLREATVAVRPTPGQLVARVHAPLASTLGTLTVESTPPGAAVRLDGQPRGATPVAIPGVALDQRHRVDLQLAGHEIDQVVVLPEKDGALVHRTLTPAAPAARPRDGAAPR